VLRDGETEVSGKRLTYLIAADEVLLEEAVQATVPSNAARAAPEEAGPGRGGQAHAPLPQGGTRPTEAAPVAPRAAPAPARPAGGGS